MTKGTAPGFFTTDVAPMKETRGINKIANIYKSIDHEVGLRRSVLMQEKIKKSHTPSKWLLMIGNQFGHCCLKLMDNPDGFRSELVTLAAIIVFAIEDYDNHARYRVGRQPESGG